MPHLRDTRFAAPEEPLTGPQRRDLRMNEQVQPEVDWRSWARRWEAQQVGYVPEREERFTAMLETLACLLPETFVAVDLASGPGSISHCTRPASARRERSGRSFRIASC